MYKLTYTYDNFGRVRSVTESAQDISKLTGFQEGNVITVTADGPKQVTFSDKIGTHETIQFDKYGKTVLVSDARGNYVDAESGIQRTLGINILKNQSFENGWTNWEYDAETLRLKELHRTHIRVRMRRSCLPIQKRIPDLHKLCRLQAAVRIHFPHTSKHRAATRRRIGL